MNANTIAAANAIIEKYTTQPNFISAEEIGDPALGIFNRLLADAANRIASTESDLMGAATELENLARKIRANVEAGPTDRVWPLNSFGEVSGSVIGRIDALLARRDEQISALRKLVGEIIGY